MTVDEKEITLITFDALSRYVGRGNARIDHKLMQSIGVSEGDIISILGKKRTVARVLSLDPTENKNIIQIDGLIRHNATVALGDTVRIKKITAVPAEVLFFSPVEAIPPLADGYIADALENVPLSQDDHFMIPYFGGRLTFQVHEVKPNAEAVFVTKKTSLLMIKTESMAPWYKPRGNNVILSFKVTLSEKKRSGHDLILKFSLFLNEYEEKGEFPLHLKEVQPFDIKYYDKAQEIVKIANEKLADCDLPSDLIPIYLIKGIKLEILENWKNM